jgi:3-ketoacyl-CoA synthase
MPRKDASIVEEPPPPSAGLASSGRSESGSTINGGLDNIYLVAPNSIRLTIINWSHVMQSKYVPFLIFCTLAGSGLLVTHSVFQLRLLPQAFEDVLLQARNTVVDDAKVSQAQAHMLGLYLTMGWKWALFVALFTLYFFNSQRPVYLLDFSTFKPPKEWQVTHEDLVRIMREVNPDFTDETIEFTERLAARSGTSQSTHWPPGLVDNKGGKEVSLANARKEAETVLFTIVEDVLGKTGLKPRDIDILIVNCSIFCPTPSMCAMIANHFKMRSDIESYNLSGMGCSAGVISVHLAKQLLQARAHCTALVVSTENITCNLYKGNERRFLVQNTLFRCGGAAIVLSNKWLDGLTRAKYKLLHTIRHQDHSDDSYRCVYQEEDELGNLGVSLGKQITQTAGRALKSNLTKMGPLILPVRELCAVLFTTASRSVIKSAQKKGLLMTWEPPMVHVPDFKKAVQHFCIHAGGRAVIDGIKENLSLSDKQVEPSVQTLFKYGNTSSSSIWYELEFIEMQKDEGPSKMHRGDRIIQLAFGSGFKCNSAVWLRIA